MICCRLLMINTIDIDRNDIINMFYKLKNKYLDNKDMFPW
jgi:hypothetical protein